MTVKIIGAILVIASSLLCAGRIATLHRREGHALRALHSALYHMRWALEEQRPPLPVLLETASECADRCVARFFSVLGEELREQVLPDGPSCVRAALVRCADLPAATRKILLGLGDTLGCFALEGQLSGIRAAIRECEEAAAGQASFAAEKCRTMQALCLCVGAALAIALF